MQRILLIIGEDLRLNKPLIDEIFEIYLEKFKEFSDIKFINKNDMDLPFNISNLTMSYDEMVIYCTAESYHIVSKILATLKSDLLELKSHETLAPSTADKIIKNGFEITINKATINLIKVAPNEKVPQILLGFTPNFVNFYLLGEQSFSEELDKIASVFEVSLTCTKISQFLSIARAQERKFGKLNEFINQAKAQIGQRVIFEESLAKFSVMKLKQLGAKITFAESCTCGLAACKLGEVSGASEVFDGSLVSYSNQIKHIWLNVSEETLARYGAVSGECVYEMLNGALEATGATFAIAISGIAGPSGATLDKPVGTVFVGVGQKNGETVVEEFNILGTRNYVREQSALIAYSMLLLLRKDLFLSDF